MGEIVILVAVFTFGMYILDHQGPKDEKKSDTTTPMRRDDNMLPTRSFLDSDPIMDIVRRNNSLIPYGGT